MPISGGKYVAPTWNNGSSPAINAAELQAISNTLAAVQTRAIVEVVSYTGTGTYGSSNPCSITFTTVPDMVIALDSSGSLRIPGGDAYSRLWLKPSLLTTTYQANNGFYFGDYSSISYGRIQNGGKTIQWYSTGSSTNQLNISGVTYYFLGITEVTTP